MASKKVIISHDIDHINIRLTLPSLLFYFKMIIKALMELITGRITLATFFLRIKKVAVRNNNIVDLLNFNVSHDVINNFFIASENGRSLFYEISSAREVVKLLTDSGANIFLHGIHGKVSLLDQKIKFEKEYNIQCKGHRFHYLSGSINDFQAELSAFDFDSSLYRVFDFSSKAFKEYPLALMDVSELNGKYGLIRNIDVIKIVEENLLYIEKLCSMDIVPVIDFHDCYYSSAYPNFKLWYEFLITELKRKGYDFVGFEN